VEDQERGDGVDAVAGGGGLVVVGVELGDEVAAGGFGGVVFTSSSGGAVWGIVSSLTAFFSVTANSSTFQFQYVRSRDYTCNSLEILY